MDEIVKEGTYKGVVYTIWKKVVGYLRDASWWYGAYIKVTDDETSPIDYKQYPLDVHGGVDFGGHLIGLKGQWIGWEYAEPYDDLHFPSEGSNTRNMLHDWKIEEVEEECRRAIDQYLSIENRNT